MTQYVLGFAFTYDYVGFNRVLLIRKKKPEWQAGRLNGIGGKIELNDVSPHAAMAREFREEAGLDSSPTGWTKFAELKFPEAQIHCFSTWWEWKVFKKAHSCTEEPIESYQIDDRFYKKMVDRGALYNLHWLIPMGLAAWHSAEHAPLQISELPVERGYHNPKNV